MLDINLIREKPEWVKEQIGKLNDAPALARINAILELDKTRRTLLADSETVQAARNKLNKGVGKLRGDKQTPDGMRAAMARHIALAVREGEFEEAISVIEGGGSVNAPRKDDNLNEAMDEMMAALKGMGERVEAINDQLRGIDADLQENMYWLPNMPHESVPVFDSEEHNIAWPVEGVIREFDFEPKPHWELGPELDIIDFERGVKLAGSRAYVLKGFGARLQRALVSFYLDMARQKGFTQVNVPYFVKEDMMYGAGQFPKFRDVVYNDPDAEVYMLPTAEVAITNLHRDEILDEAQLPIFYVAHTPCFRREKTSAGRDVRGIKRVHQFEKVEMYKFTSPETSYAELESLTEAAADICRKLGLAFRRLEIVTGDLGFSASKKYDIEVWSPGCKEWLEVSSCSNTETFQARRANVKYRPTESKKAQFVHTLNGSGLADTRVIIAILENYQQADGSVIIPEVLRPYMGGADVITR
ncbi:MAG: serine--tRNA ligase [Chloroflexi bacterium]|nr:serine--tRNA ligase [Chloroflexota bacterium]MCC6893439.1 serine--tRNA ligase [Anaerolineae bacterium]